MTEKRKEEMLRRGKRERRDRKGTGKGCGSVLWPQSIGCVHVVCVGRRVYVVCMLCVCAQVHVCLCACVC